jgi:hypothetical protein
VNQLSEKDLQMHVRIVGWLNIVGNSIFLLIGLCGFVFMSGMGLVAAADSGDGIALLILARRSGH